MAYEKKTVQEYITETGDKTVEGYNNNQEDRIEYMASGVDVVASKIIKSFYVNKDGGTIEAVKTIWNSLPSGEPIILYITGTYPRVLFGYKENNSYGSFMETTHSYGKGGVRSLTILDGDWQERQFTQE